MSANMLMTLRFVRGAVAEKDHVPVLTHFRIQNGRIQGSNGRMAIDAPCPQLSEVDILVPADRFVKAIDSCDEEPTLKITEGGKLSISLKPFRVLLPLAEVGDFPMQQPTGVSVGCPVGLKNVFKRLRPFVGSDASRPWQCGILLRDGLAYATNNVTMACMKLPWTGGDIVLPSYAVDEVLRVQFEPTELLLDKTSMTFHYGTAWMKTQLLNLEWPNVQDMFVSGVLPAAPESMLAAVQKIIPFCPNKKFPAIQLSERGVSTSEGDMMATVEGDILPNSMFRAEPLQAVLNEALAIDFTPYPKPCPWYGDGIKGLLMGVIL